MFEGIFNNKRVLVTGHTGFKGSWLTEWLIRLGAQVHGLSLPVSQKNRLFKNLELEQRVSDSTFADIRSQNDVRKAFDQACPDFVFHLAAQPLVRASYDAPIETHTTNIIGTANILEVLRQTNRKTSAVLVTTDKCYENKEWEYSYRECDPLGGHDPYSASKACAEIVAASYQHSFFHLQKDIRVSTARAGNVIGGGDWAEDRIIPDIINCLEKEIPVPVRNKCATRPWQHVLEPLSGYLWLAASLHKAAPEAVTAHDSFNFGPELRSNQTVATLVKQALRSTKGTWIDQSDPNEPHEATRLNLAIDKAFHLLGWQPTWDFETSVRMTMEWYVAEREDSSLIHFTQQQITNYCADAKALCLNWTAMTASPTTKQTNSKNSQ